MKLYSTLTSPYGRMARIVLHEKGLQDRVEFIAVKTRGAENSYYSINPSGRVPSLVLENGVVLEESALVCWYLDNVDGDPLLHSTEGIDKLEIRRLEAMARSMLDGISLWSREYLYREKKHHSEQIIEHERLRALRFADVFEKEVLSPIMYGNLNMAQITLSCVLHDRKNNNPEGFLWQDGRANLCNWVKRIGQHYSIANTTPPPRRYKK